MHHPRPHTSTSAYAAFDEKQKRNIAPGKVGDIVVLSDDLFSIAPEKIKHAHVVLTVVGGGSCTKRCNFGACHLLLEEICGKLDASSGTPSMRAFTWRKDC